jgi:hypothetical protein
MNRADDCVQEVLYYDIVDAGTQRAFHYGIVSALSVHQLAAQGEMLYLATRIEQGNTYF